ncbi:MAG: spermine synthase [Gemmatimonadetes bacterium]|nr:spermine synthase [Gemmatimonadota bacterium]
MHPDRPKPRFAALRAALVGLALGVDLFAAGSLLLAAGAGSTSAAAGLAATFLVSLAAGGWAGAPGARTGTPVWRWLIAAVSLGVAAAFGTAWGVDGAAGHTAPARALGLLVMVGVPAYALGMLVPALAAWEQRADEGDDRLPDDGDDSGFGVAGSLALRLVLGLAAGSALCGLVLVPRFPPGPVLAVVAVLVSLPFYFPRGEEEGAGETTLFETETAFGSIRVAEIAFAAKRHPERRLYLNDEIESGELVRTGAPTFGYIAAAEKWLGEVARRGDAFLFLGGGAYTLPRRIAERDETARIAVVELDPAVTRAAYRWFGLRTEHRVASLHGDARSVAQALPPESFDRVFVDVYDGSESMPYSLVTREAWECVRRLLRPGGTVLVNVIGVADGEGDLRFWSTVRTFAEVFADARLYAHLSRDYPDRQNFLLAAGIDALPRLPTRAGLFDPWPRPEWPALHDVVTFRDSTLVAISDDAHDAGLEAAGLDDDALDEDDSIDDDDGFDDDDSVDGDGRFADDDRVHDDPRAPSDHTAPRIQHPVSSDEAPRDHHGRAGAD